MTNARAEHLPYPDRFLSPKAAEAYEREEYATDSYAMAIWAQQAPLVKKLLLEVHEQDPVGRHLDFACGTGRITRLAEEVFPEVDALDISPAMVEIARAAGRQAHFSVGNILEENDLCAGPYASITTFRLVLNLDPSLRIPVLSQLNRRLKQGGVLILHLHGNRYSLRHFALVWKKWKNRRAPSSGEIMFNEMSQKEVVECLAASGFQVERVYGSGILPQAVYRWPLRSLWRGLDRWLTGLSFLKRFSIDLIFVCKKKEISTL